MDGSGNTGSLQTLYTKNKSNSYLLRLAFTGGSVRNASRYRYKQGHLY